MPSGKWKEGQSGAEGGGGLRIDIKAKSQNPKPKSFVFIVISMRNIASASTRGCGGCTGCRERVGFNQR